MAERSTVDKLCTASANGDLSQVLNLLENGADVNGFNRFNRTALQVVMLGNTPVVKVLLEAGADPNKRDPVFSLTVTHDASRAGFVETVRALMSHGADVNLVDTRGNLPLHLAAMEGQQPVVELLIGHTADPETANHQGYTAGQLALRYGKTITAQYIDAYLTSCE